jgi:hypothetical protein
MNTHIVQCLSAWTWVDHQNLLCRLQVQRDYFLHTWYCFGNDPVELSQELLYWMLAIHEYDCIPCQNSNELICMRWQKEFGIKYGVYLSTSYMLTVKMSIFNDPIQCEASKWLTIYKMLNLHINLFTILQFYLPAAAGCHMGYRNLFWGLRPFDISGKSTFWPTTFWHLVFLRWTFGGRH